MSGAESSNPKNGLLTQLRLLEPLSHQQCSRLFIQQPTMLKVIYPATNNAQGIPPNLPAEGDQFPAHLDNERWINTLAEIEVIEEAYKKALAILWFYPLCIKLIINK